MTKVENASPICKRIWVGGQEVHTSTTTHHTNHLLIDLEIELIRLVTGKRAHTFIYLPVKMSQDDIPIS